MNIKQILNDMVEIPAGEFMMGSEKEWSEEKPVHLVSLEAFSIGKYQVTQDQYETVMGYNPSRFRGKSRPVERVSWNDAKKFCQKLTELAGNPDFDFALPSEAQWEYACRAGSKGRWCFGDDVAKLEDYAWYDDNSGGQTYLVGEKKPNAFGLYDMHGNVWEWCEDHWHDNYENAPTDGSSWIDNDADTDRPHVVRGGSWYSFAVDCRSAYRDDDHPECRKYAVGFRVVLVETVRIESDSEPMKGSIEIYSKKKEGED